MLNYKRIFAFVLVVILTLSIVIATSSDLVRGLRLGLDLKGGFEILYEAEPIEKGGVISKEALIHTAKSLAKRIDQLGTADPEIRPEGENRIRVRIAGVEDENKLREILKKPAELTFRGPAGTIELQGNDFVEGAANVGFDEFNNPVVHVEVKDSGKLQQVTTKLYNRMLGIYLDDTMLSTPIIEDIMTDGKARISGSFTYEEAKELADIINSGALPLKLTEKYMQSVGASLGQQSLEETVFAGMLASIFILLFMVAMYRIPGVVACITLIVYTWGLLLVFYWLNATLTLPGIAAFVLGIGMAVDANIITYERFKEELRSGKSIASALRAGSRNSIRTIMDANITTFIAALVLFYIGTGAIMGFALTLMLSIGLSILTNVFLSQGLLSLLIKGNLFRKPVFYGVRANQIQAIHEKEEIKRIEKWGFLKHSKKFFAFSISISALGALTLLLFQLNYGVDFKAGTSLDIVLNQQIDKSQAETIIADTGLEQSSLTIGGVNEDRVSVRFAQVLDTNEGEVKKIIDSFTEYAGNRVSYEENTVDPVMAQELAEKALIAVGLASIGILIYISIRFEWRFALAAVIALLHNAFFVISIFSMFRLEVNLPFIAAILTIIGYSINDTVVIFDRIRENLRKAKLKSFAELTLLVNLSINQTFTRSVNTGITVLVAAVGMMIFGSQSIFLFSLAMAIGLIIGMYSSLFIASQIWLLFMRGNEMFK